MARYASGKKSVALCDRCGQQYPYQDLKEQIENKRPNGLRVCPPCLDKDHPQLQLGRQRIVDPQALRHPRPDRVEPASNIIAFQTLYPHTAGENRFSISGINISTSFNMTTAGSTSITTPSANFSSAFVQTTAGAVVSSATTYNVFVQGAGATGYGTGNRYFFAGISGPAPTLTLNEGSTYIFDQSDSSNAGHPLRFSTTPNGTHNGGSEYTTGVTVVGTPGNAGAYTQIAVASSAPTLYYYCTNHANMGWVAHTPPGTTENLVIVTVTNTGSGNAFRHNQQTVGVSGVDINEGEAYIFDQSDSSNSGHPLRFSTTAGGSHSGGSEYTTGVTVVGTPGSAGAYVRILVAANAPTLYTYCTNHSLMGYRVNTV